MKSPSIFTDLILVTFLCSLCTVALPAQEACCWREVIVEFKGPAELSSSDVNWIETSFARHFKSTSSGQVSDIDDCDPGFPLEVYVFQRPSELPAKIQQAIEYGMLPADYAILGKIERTEIQLYGGKMDTFTSLEVTLMDAIRGVNISSGRVEWFDLERGLEYIKELATSEAFSPLDKVLYDYEQIPLKCRIVPSEEEIYVGEEMTIDLSRIYHKDNPAKPWHWVFVQVEKGSLKNGQFCEYVEGKKVWGFPVGGGALSLQYVAPAGCQGKNEKETITVFNSCYEGRWCLLEEGIANRSFKILCKPELEIDATFFSSMGTISWKGRIPLKITGEKKVQGEGVLTVEGNLNMMGAVGFVLQGVETLKIEGVLKEVDPDHLLLEHRGEKVWAHWQMVEYAPGVQLNYDVIFQRTGFKTSIEGVIGDCGCWGSLDKIPPSGQFLLSCICPDFAFTVWHPFPTILNSTPSPMLEPIEWKDGGVKVYEYGVPGAYSKATITIHLAEDPS